MVILNINPPPEDRRCEVCNKHINELNPYGGKGDPLVGDFKGAKLVKIFRPMAQRDVILWDVKGILNEEGILDEDKFIERYGKEELSNYYFHEQLQDTIEPSWECRDCILLNEERYFDKKYGTGH